MNVILNGERTSVPPSIDLSELLEHLSMPARLIAVELNGRVVRRKDWPETTVREDDKIEIVHFVGGG